MNVAAVLAAVFATAVLAAPDEEALGKAHGYPVCHPSKNGFEQHCLVGQFSRYDEVVPARKVAKGATSRPLKRASRELNLRYEGKYSRGDIDQFMDANRNTGLMLMKGNTILIERYQYDRTPQHRFTSQSMAKTVVAMLIGVAFAEGYIRSIDDPVALYVPELKGHAYGETPLRHLLTMSSGVKFVEGYGSDSDVMELSRRTLHHEGPGGVDSVRPFNTRLHKPGTKFSYSSADAQVLGLVLRRATGKPIAKYLSEKIWQPMGAEHDASWLVDAGGYEIAFCCLNVTLRDLGRLGLLLANGGVLGGQEIIPLEWVQAATTIPAPYLDFPGPHEIDGYGYQTWILPGKDRRFLAMGIFGQGLFVDQRSKLVMVHTAVHELPVDPSRIDQFALFNAALRRMEN